MMSAAAPAALLLTISPAARQHFASPYDRYIDQEAGEHDRGRNHQHFRHVRISPLTPGLFARLFASGRRNAQRAPAFAFDAPAGWLVAAVASTAVAIAVTAKGIGKGPVQEDITVETDAYPKHEQNHEYDEDDHSNRIEHIFSQPDEKSDA